MTEKSRGLLEQRVAFRKNREFETFLSVHIFTSYRQKLSKSQVKSSQVFKYVNYLYLVSPEKMKRSLYTLF